MPSPGRVELDAADNEHCWQRFQAAFAFRAGVDARAWPAIREPVPSVTLDLRLIFERDRAEFEAGAAAVNAEVWRALTGQLPAGAPLLALDWQHTGYRVLPTAAGDAGRMPVPAFPDGDYYALLTEDFSTGTFGHPWERTLCVFGAPLVATLGAALGMWLPALRIDGRAINRPPSRQR